MTPNKTLLVVDDHPVYIDALYNILKENKSYEFLKAGNCKDAFYSITALSEQNKNLDVAIVDIGLPPFKQLKSGVDVAIFVKNTFPNCKIIIMTAFLDILTIRKLQDTKEIAAILCKSDFDITDFVSILETVMNGNYYLSTTIKEKISHFTKQKFKIDFLDLEILKKISEGIKTNELPSHIPLSLSAIEKRKSNLKKLFLKNDGNDNDLILAITKIGLV